MCTETEWLDCSERYGTLTEDPVERLELVSLNGVALRPSVNSEEGGKKKKKET